MEQCPVPAVPSGPLRIKDLPAGPGTRKGRPIVVRTQQHVYLDGATVSRAVQSSQLRHARRNVALRPCSACGLRRTKLAAGVWTCPWCDSP